MAPNIARTGLYRLVLVLAAGLFIAGGGALGFLLSERSGIAELRRDSNHRLDLFSSAAQGVIKQLEHVPATVQLNPLVLELLREPTDTRRLDAANDYLRRLNAHLGSMAVFVLNERGIVLASSNGDRPDDSRLREDMSFRPYYLEALSGRVGRHFAIGVNGGEPGYFVSHPIRDGSRVVGVAAIKIGLDAIDQIWETVGAHALLVDTNQVVILSSQPEWRYTALADLPLERRVDLQLTRLYNNRRIARFPMPVQLAGDEDSQVLDGMLPGDVVAAQRSGNPTMLALSRTLPGMDWRLVTFSDLAGVRSQALLYGVMSSTAAAFLVLLSFSLAQRRRILRQKHEARLLLERVNLELEQNVASRTQALTDANEQLRTEVNERQRTEQTLRDAQGELVHAAKLAILGQLASGMTHELTQPLGAIRTLAGNASEFLRRGDLRALEGNLGIIARMADRMGSIIQPLKRFGRKATAAPAACDVAHAVANALLLYESRLRKEGVLRVDNCSPGAVTVWCDPNRLEQVLVNLIGNAIDAMDQMPHKVLTITAATCPAPPQAAGFAEQPGADLVAGSEWVRIDVLDTGAGLDDQTRTRLFEPFFTTKPDGAGTGLGLPISRDIVREFGGDIEAASRPEGGARFSLYLPPRSRGDSNDS